MTDSKDNAHKVVILGSGAVGKSALAIRFVSDRFIDDYDPTIEDTYRKQYEIDGKTSVLDILDTAGQDEFASMQEHWIQEGSGFLLVYSIVKKQTLNELKELRKKILQIKETWPPVVLAGNKVDLRDDKENTQVTKQEGEELAKEWNVPFLETSAKTKINDSECFIEVVREIR